MEKNKKYLVGRDPNDGLVVIKLENIKDVRSISDELSKYDIESQHLINIKAFGDGRPLMVILDKYKGGNGRHLFYSVDSTYGKNGLAELLKNNGVSRVNVDTADFMYTFEPWRSNPKEKSIEDAIDELIEYYTNNNVEKKRLQRFESFDEDGKCIHDMIAFPVIAVNLEECADVCYLSEKHSQENEILYVEGTDQEPDGGQAENRQHAGREDKEESD